MSAEYALVCDACREPLSAADALVSWSSEGEVERGFALTHAAHAPEGATGRFEGRLIVSPNGYLRFIGERLGKHVEDPAALRAILWSLAPFVMRPDNPAEMDSMRAASFGAIPGVKPGTQPSALAAGAQEQHDAGK